MAGDLYKILLSMETGLANLRNQMDGIVDETIPQRLNKPWKNFRSTNEEVIDRLEKITSYLKNKKDDKPEPVMQADLEKLIKKWRSVNNVYGGLLMVAEQCKETMKTWDSVEKELKKL